MIENELQYQTTLSKLKDFEQQLAALDPQDPNLHPRQIIGWRNSFNLTIRQLKQEIAEYEKLSLVNNIINRPIEYQNLKINHNDLKKHLQSLVLESVTIIVKIEILNFIKKTSQVLQPLFKSHASLFYRFRYEKLLSKLNNELIQLEKDLLTETDPKGKYELRQMTTDLNRINDRKIKLMIAESKRIEEAKNIEDEE
jgi:hypothetical protein